MQACKPGSVSGKILISIIYPGMPLLTCSNDLPTNIGRAALHALAYLVFQLLGFTEMYVAIQGRELLPHVFTFSARIAPGGSLFSVALSVSGFTRAFPLGSKMLCVARTFLSPIKLDSDRTACRCKYTVFGLE